MAKNNGWKTLDGQNVEDVYEAIRQTYLDAVERNSGAVFAYIGTDSQNIGQKFTSFVQCIALHTFDDTGIGKGGRVFYIRHLESRHRNRNKRLLREIEISVTLAQKIEPIFSELDIPFEIHADINSDPGNDNQNKSHEVHDAAVGWIAGMGWEVRTKPQAFVASIIADRHVRGVRKIKPIRKKGKK